jgi:hypothetical protein
LVPNILFYCENETPSSPFVSPSGRIAISLM